MPIEQILITVRTYPTLSEKYQETVCTGGINRDGQWRRLYPVQWRLLDKEKQYRQYDLIEASIGETTSDGRPESRRIDASTIKLADRVNDWKTRIDWVRPTVCESLDQMKALGRTLAPVRVQVVKEFRAIPDTAEWSPKQQELLRQDGLFEGPEPLEKIPFDFRLVWIDGEGQEHNSKFIDWEVCQTWRAYRNRYENPIDVMRQKWMSTHFAADRAIYFYMGNFAQHPKAYGVCGVFFPPKVDFDEQSLW